MCCKLCQINLIKLNIKNIFKNTYFMSLRFSLNDLSISNCLKSVLCKKS